MLNVVRTTKTSLKCEITEKNEIEQENKILNRSWFIYVL